MTYKLILKGDSKSVGVIDERVVATDEELTSFIGKFAMWYFLSIERVDYEDAKLTSWGESGADRLLAFTSLKETDTLEGPHRHGLPKGVLAYGKAWCWAGQGVKVSLIVERQ